MQNADGGKDVMICALFFLLICAVMKFVGEIPVASVQFIKSDIRGIKSTGAHAQSLAHGNLLGVEEKFDKFAAH